MIAHKINDTMGTQKVTGEWKKIDDLEISFNATSALTCVNFSGFFRKERGEVVGLALRLLDQDIHISVTQRHVVTYPNAEAGSTVSFSWYLETEAGREYKIAIEAQHSASGRQKVYCLHM